MLLMSLNAVLLVFCSLLLCGRAETHEVTEAVGQGCFQSPTQLRALVEGVFGEGYNVSMNCMSFDQNGALYKAIASGFSERDSNTRYMFTCTDNVVIAQQSNESVSMINMDTACVSCEDVPQPCMTPCPPTCERCYNSSDDTQCSVCTACTGSTVSECSPAALMDSQMCEVLCPMSSLHKPVAENNLCVCTGVLQLQNYPPGEGAPGTPPHEPDTENPLCLPQCTEHNYVPNNHTNICYACGLEFCVECEDNHCSGCLLGSELHNGECVAGDLAEVVRVAEEQQEEVEEEEAASYRTQIILAVVLPIVCVGVIIFFVIMAVIAHIRYPHVSYHGQKRHRQMPEASPPPEHETVWRARPTIRLR